MDKPAEVPVDDDALESIPSDTMQVAPDPTRRRTQSKEVWYLAGTLVGASVVSAIFAGIGVIALLLFVAGAAILALQFRSSPLVAHLAAAWSQPKFRGGFFAAVALLVLIAFFGGQSLERTAMSLVTESYQESGGTAKCVEIEITGDGGWENSYNAIATMSNGRTLPILIIDGEDEISVTPVGGSQFGMFPKSRKK